MVVKSAVSANVFVSRNDGGMESNPITIHFNPNVRETGGGRRERLFSGLEEHFQHVGSVDSLILEEQREYGKTSISIRRCPTLCSTIEVRDLPRDSESFPLGGKVINL